MIVKSREMFICVSVIISEATIWGQMSYEWEQKNENESKAPVNMEFIVYQLVIKHTTPGKGNSL
jgi:hypothetical protein